MRELINTIAHIGYQVSDLTRSLAFYEPLGFQRQQRFSKPSPQGTIEVAFLEMAGYPLDEGPIEEDNVRFLLIRGPDGERLEFDACKR